MRRLPAALLALPLLLAACTQDAGAEPTGPPPATEEPAGAAQAPRDWIYQLSGYDGDALDALAATPQEVAVIDLARDGGEGYWSTEEITALKDSGKTVYAYFTMGSIETYRPEYPAVAETDLVLNQWGDWPDEYFVRYWDERWRDLVMRPRLDQAIAAGFDGVYLDVPNAYEEIDLGLVPGEDRDSLAQKMADQVKAIDEYTDDRLDVLVQNSPELIGFDGYLDAIDGLGVEELFFINPDEPCTEEWCAENLAHVREIAAAGKLILAVDYAAEEANIAAACARYEEEGFAGAVADVDLDAIFAPCP
ncbi:endo alpha-1,4 polygalactosaminidase [Glycomyces harbinensis]|uniref:Glycoside-hydrolase family GH114 TIM-barrel domain-containing protein n=1 Tax=Glycomyces harbinensis TaxID=58114 RepID=A0A1G6YSZ4_9ACTN|nr:endo alpha-1,4 polygalactosaminidase [Glycomyces harbinensis]SDD93431.1 cysteinyl-tRNA synthetase, unknown class [Glycomyces harbinensis]